MEEERVPLIIRIQQEASQRSVLPPPPDWERWIGRARVFSPRDWLWWKRALFRLSGGSPKWLPLITELRH